MAFMLRAWCCAKPDIMSVAPLELWLMIATATLCMSLPLALVTGGDDSLDNDLECDFAVPTSHGYTRAVWFEREAPSSLLLRNSILCFMRTHVMAQAYVP